MTQATRRDKEHTMTSSARLRELLEAATPRPWRWDDWGNLVNVDGKVIVIGCSVVGGGDACVAVGESDARLICAAVHALPPLLDERDALRAALAEALDAWEADTLDTRPAELRRLLTDG